MAEQWYYRHDDVKTGPWSSQQLRDLAVSGGILPTDYVWKQGIERSVLAEKVKNLFAPAPRFIATPIELETISKTPYSPKPELSAAPVQSPMSATESEALLLLGQTSNGSSASNMPHESPVTEATAFSEPESPSIPEHLELRHIEEESAAPPASSRQKTVGRARATAGKGAIIVSQDGTNVQFRKKCSTCGHEDNCRSRMPIKTGVTKVGFYCPKCRKRRDVEIQGFAN
ncbi:MAG: DUF4339 domain-containing protein [Gemmataceae bacterium]